MKSDTLMSPVGVGTLFGMLRRNQPAGRRLFEASLSRHTPTSSKAACDRNPIKGKQTLLVEEPKGPPPVQHVLRAKSQNGFLKGILRVGPYFLVLKSCHKSSNCRMVCWPLFLRIPLFFGFLCFSSFCVAVFCQIYTYIYIYITINQKKISGNPLGTPHPSWRLPVRHRHKNRDQTIPFGGVKSNASKLPAQRCSMSWLSSI